MFLTLSSGSVFVRQSVTAAQNNIKTLKSDKRESFIRRGPDKANDGIIIDLNKFSEECKM